MTDEEIKAQLQLIQDHQKQLQIQVNFHELTINQLQTHLRAITKDYSKVNQVASTSPETTCMKDVLGRPIQVGDTILVLSSYQSAPITRTVTKLIKPSTVGFPRTTYNAAHLLDSSLPEYKQIFSPIPCNECVVITSQIQSNYNDYPEEFI